MKKAYSLRRWVLALSVPQFREPFTAAYNASKHGLHGLMKTLAIELGPYEINVNAICPTSMGAMGESTERHPYWEMVYRDSRSDRGGL